MSEPTQIPEPDCLTANITWHSDKIISSAMEAEYKRAIEDAVKATDKLGIAAIDPKYRDAYCHASRAILKLKEQA